MESWIMRQNQEIPPKTRVHTLDCPSRVTQPANVSATDVLVGYLFLFFLHGNQCHVR